MCVGRSFFLILDHEATASADASKTSSYLVVVASQIGASHWQLGIKWKGELLLAPWTVEAHSVPKECG